MKTTSDKLNGYHPRHKGEINYDFCLNKCVEVDGIRVPFPDCKAHGNPFTKNSECGTIKVRP